MKRTAVLLLAIWCAASSTAVAGGMATDQALAAGDYAAAYRDSIGPARAGDPDAMLVVATLLDTGKGVSQDFAAALSWYRRAAEAGNVRAMFNTAAMFDNGRGTPVDRQEAIRWYERAAAGGEGRAAYALGVIYRDGDGVPRDRSRAIQAFRQAAVAGLEAARANLVALAAPLPPLPGRSREVPPATAAAARTPLPEIDRVQQAVLSRAQVDATTAAAFSRLLPVLVEHSAKGNSNGIGLYDMGYAYQHGFGISQDRVRSYVYYLQAAVSAEPTTRSAALRGATEVGASLTEAEHRAAQARLLEGQ